MRVRPLDVALAVVLAALPLVLRSPLPTWLRIVVALGVAAAATAATTRDVGRTPVAVGLVAWLGVSIAGSQDGGALVAVPGGLLLRVWCGLPELRAIGRPVLPDLAPELLGGAAAAALVLAVAEARGGLPPAVLIAALASAAVLVAAGLARVRR